MAKTESTAVNALIDQVASGKPQAADPGADLFSAPKSTSVNPPRMTTPIPALRNAGEVAPLPRARSPRATSQNAKPSQIRMSTAEPSLGNTIPPLSRPTSKPAVPPHRTSAPLPAPRNTPRSTGQVPTRPSTVPPKTAPVAAPFEARRVPSLPALPGGYPLVKREPTVDMTGDVVKAENWFDVSAAVHKLDASEGTHVVARPDRETISLIKKMIAPTIILAIIGAMIGGFFAFNGDGGKKKKPSAAPAAAAAMPQPETRVAMTAAPNVPASPESANAATASAGAEQPEPPTKAEDLARQEAAAAETAKHPAAESESMLPAATTAALTHEPPAPAPAAEAPKAETPKADAAKPAVPAAVAPAPAPAGAEVVAVKALKTSNEPAVVREVRTARGVVKLVDVRIDSKPSGATVTLVDAGKTSFLGTTPLATSLDPSRKYDVIFALAGRPTQMAPLDPSATSKLDVTLGRAHHSSSAKKEATPKLDSFIEKPAATDKAAASEKPEKKIAAPVEKKSAEPAGEGTLMVSSKPPCEIVVDGKPTGLTTPQRSLPLSAGKHQITFVNDAEGIKKTVSVTITADQSTKLIQDLMKK